MDSSSSPTSHGGFGANMQQNGSRFASLYSALFSDKPSVSSLHQCEGNSELKYCDSAIQNHLHDSCAIQKHQDMVNRHSICLTRLLETSKEVEALRQENTHLRAVNVELNKQLSLLVHASAPNQFDGSAGHTASFDVANGFHGLHIGDNIRDGKLENNNCSDWKEQEVSDESPTSVIETERFSLPKSISVRSNGYLKIAQTGAASNASRTKGAATRPRTSTPQLDAVQKVYVRGGKKEEEPLEMVVYNQGMFKTELCNKWQETGACPYGDHCQFAHGIEELRPVIRHPRYKTEVCRMVLAGVLCPYGHRCHFRHALTEQEKAIGQAKPRAMKLER